METRPSTDHRAAIWFDAVQRGNALEVGRLLAEGFDVEAKTPADWAPRDMRQACEALVQAREVGRSARAVEAARIKGARL